MPNIKLKSIRDEQKTAPAKMFGQADVVDLIKRYMPLVRQIARRYSHFHPDSMEDLTQVGSIGLLKAIGYYDPGRAHCASFKTLAMHYIRGEIRHYLRDYSSLVQVPRRLSEINGQLNHLEEHLSKLLERMPNIKELAEASGYSIQEILQAQQSWEARIQYESLDSITDDEDRDDKRNLSELLPDKKYQEWLCASEDRELVRQALDHLGVKAREIIEFVFFYDLSQKETASVLGLSEMGVSRAVHNALKTLREILQIEAR